MHKLSRLLAVHKLKVRTPSLSVQSIARVLAIRHLSKSGPLRPEIPIDPPQAPPAQRRFRATD